MDKERIIKEVDKKIDALVEQGLTSTATIDALDKLVDMKKDLIKIEKMEGERYGNYPRHEEYDNYGDDMYGKRQRDSQGRYMERGMGARYRGHDMIDDMYREYGNYSAGKEEYNRNRGNYGAKEDTIQSLKAMLESCVDFFEMLKREASSQEELNLVKQYAKKISEM